MGTLIKKLELAIEGSRELDVRIEITRRSFLAGLGAAAVATEIARIESQIGFVQFAEAEEVPRYSHSLDAALTLVPEGYGWGVTNPKHWDGNKEDKRPYARLYKTDAVNDKKGTGPTPALALCIAALRAQAMEEAA